MYLLIYEQYLLSKIKPYMNTHNDNSNRLINKEVDNAVDTQSSSLLFEFTHDQYLYIQHYLPKGYVLIDRKFLKKDKKQLPINSQEIENISLISGTDEGDPRTKRERSKMKKTDRYLEEDLPRQIKRQPSDKLINHSQQFKQCQKILNLLKQHANAEPFLQPVNPKTSGALNYYDVVKQPMDLWTIQKNLKEGYYNSSQQFHDDIKKIWKNSYTYNQQNYNMYKITNQMQQYYNKINHTIPNQYTNDKKINKLPHKKNFLKRLRVLPEAGRGEVMAMLIETGKFPKNNIELDYEQMDVATLQQVDDIIKDVENKYRVYQPKTIQPAQYHDQNSIA